MFSGKVKKFNKYNMKQDRILVITLNRIINIKDKSLKWEIDIQMLKGVTKSLSMNDGEFVVHVSSG